MRTVISISAAATLFAAVGAAAQPTTAPTTSSVESATTKSTQTPFTLESPPLAQDQSGGAAAPTSQLGKVVVTSDLDVARAQIAPSLGASTYTQTPTQIQNIPGGANAPFQQVLYAHPAWSRIRSARNTSAASTRTSPTASMACYSRSPSASSHRSWTPGSSIPLPSSRVRCRRNMDFTLLASWTCRPNPATR